MLAYGTAVVAGVRPGAGGQTVAGVPVYDSVLEATAQHQIDATVLFVPARLVKDAAQEAFAAGIKLVVIVSEHVPLHDAMQIMARRAQHQAVVVGPNTPGLVSPPERSLLGFLPVQYFTPGPVGVASRSGTLTYELVSRLTAAGMGQSTVVGVGGDRIPGLRFADVLRRFEQDPDTKAVLLVGEIGGTMEEEVADQVRSRGLSKPVVAYLAGQTAPEGTKMGHAGAIVEGGRGSMASKLTALHGAGIEVARHPADAICKIRRLLG